jgi:hypothetical protein
MEALTDEQRELAAAPESLALARRVAREYKRHLNGVRTLPLADLYSAALLGLVDAARRFDPGRGARFTTFARRRVAGAVVEYVREMGGHGMYPRAAIAAGAARPPGELGAGGLEKPRLAPRVVVRRWYDHREPAPRAAVRTVDEVVREHVTAVLAALGGRRAEAAAALGVCPKTLYNWLARWDKAPPGAGLTGERGK